MIFMLEMRRNSMHDCQDAEGSDVMSFSYWARPLLYYPLSQHLSRA